MQKQGMLVAVAAAALVAPAAAQAATQTVTAGPHKKATGAPETVDFNAYFPAKLRVARGDTVSFGFRGLHTVDFKHDVPFEIRETGKPISGVNDAAGNPFWFNGQDRLIVNPRAGFPVGDGVIDKARNDDGSGTPPPQGPPPPYKVRFQKTGTFHYFCDVHPGMRGKVTVVPKRKRVPSKRSVAAQADLQLARLIRIAKRKERFDGPGGNQVRMGNDTVEVAFFRYFPSTLSIKAGETVTFDLPAPSSEIHTASVASPEYATAVNDALVGPDMSTTPPTLVLNPIAFLPSDPPGAFPAHSASLHGNGFISTGAVGPDPSSPLPQSASITFRDPGTYTVYCLIHAPDMKMTVNVAS